MLCEVALTASIKVLIPCLLTCVAYLVIFNIDTMHTRVFHCDACVAMSWFILVLMLCMSFVVAVPVRQLKHLRGRVVSSFYNGCMSMVGWIAVILWQKLWLFHQNCICPWCWIVPVEVLTVAGLGLMDTVLRIRAVVVSCQTVYWRSSSGIPSFLVRYVQ